MQKQLLEVVQDVQHLLKKTGVISDQKMNEFIDFGLRMINKKLNLKSHNDQHLENDDSGFLI